MSYEPMSVPVLMLDNVGTLVGINDFLLKRFGYLRQDLLGQPVELLVPPQFRQGHPAHIRSFFAQPQARSLNFQNKFWGYTKDGEEFPVEISIHMIDINGQKYAVGLIVELTALKEAEKDLRDEEAKMALAIKASGIGVWTWDVKSGDIIWDDRMFELYELPPQPVLGYQDWAKRLHPDDAQRAEQSLAKSFGDKVPWNEEFRLALPDGGCRYIQASVEFVVDPNTGEIVKGIGANIDITEIREAEMLLVEKSQEIDAFSGRVAHDLRGPMGTIVSLIDLLDSCEKDEIGDICSRIRRRAKACIHIVDGLYKTCGISGTKLNLKSQFLGPIMDAACAAVIHEIEEAGATLEIGEMGVALVDEEALPQVFQNLIINALRHHHCPKEAVIRVSCEKEGNTHLLLYVDDNGPGIPKEARDRVFKAFERLSTKDSVGLGLGLHLSKRIVDLHGGMLELEDSPMGGCRFFFKLKTC